MLGAFSFKIHIYKTQPTFKMFEEIKKAIEVLNAGGIILYPTDTIWGIGCDATNENAVQKIYELKQRTESKSMIVLVANDFQLNKYVKVVPDIAWELMEASDKPITIVYPNASGLAKNIIANDNSAAIRIPQDEFCRKLLQQFKKGIVSTSANISNEKSPRNFAEISEQLKSKVDYVVNWKQDDSTPSQPSAIIKLGMNGEIEIIRK